MGGDCGGQAQGSSGGTGEERVALREMQNGRLAEWICQASGPAGHLLCDLGKLPDLSESQGLFFFFFFFLVDSTPSVEPCAELTS